MNDEELTPVDELAEILIGFLNESNLEAYTSWADPIIERLEDCGSQFPEFTPFETRRIIKQVMDTATYGDILSYGMAVGLLSMICKEAAIDLINGCESDGYVIKIVEKNNG